MDPSRVDIGELVSKAIAQAKQESRSSVEEDLTESKRFALKGEVKAEELNITTDEDVVTLIKQERRRRRAAS
jgi:hypothetical protein